MRPLLARAIPGVHAAIEGHLLQGQREDKFGIVYQDSPDWVRLSAEDPHTNESRTYPLRRMQTRVKMSPCLISIIYGSREV